MWLVKVKNSSDGRGQLVKKQVQWAEGARDQVSSGAAPQLQINTSYLAQAKPGVASYSQSFHEQPEIPIFI